MQSIYVLSATTENTIRVMQRIASIFARNRTNIEQLNVFETSMKGISHFNIVVHSDPKAIDKLVKQLSRIIELVDIKISNCIPIQNEH